MKIRWLHAERLADEYNLPVPIVIAEARLSANYEELKNSLRGMSIARAYGRAVMLGYAGYKRN